MNPSIGFGYVHRIRPPYGVVARPRSRITDEAHVALDVTSKPPGTIAWE